MSDTSLHAHERRQPALGPGTTVGLRAAVHDSPMPVTRSEKIRLDITGQILGGRLRPGTALDEQALATAYGVSRTPIREALRLLAASGLVEFRPHRGAEVTAPSEQDLRDMFEVMADLEALCARHAAKAMAPAARLALRALHDDMAAIVRIGDGAAYAGANEHFHGLISQGSGNRYLADLTLQTRQRLRPFRRAQFDSLGRLAGSHAEHGAIVQAVLRGDSSAAQRLMADHIGVVRDAYLNLARGVG